VIDGAEEYRVEPGSERNAGDQTNIFPVDGGRRSKLKSWLVHVKDRLQVAICELVWVDDDGDIFKNTLQSQNTKQNPCAQFGKIKGIAWQTDAFSDDVWRCRVSQTVECCATGVMWRSSWHGPEHVGPQGHIWVRFACCWLAAPSRRVLRHFGTGAEVSSDTSAPVPKCPGHFGTKYRCRSVLGPKCPGAEVSVKHSPLLS